MAILAGTGGASVSLGTLIGGGALYGISQMAPGVKRDIKLPDVDHKYASTEEMEDVASGAIESFGESVGWEQAGIKGLGSLFDLSHWEYGLFYWRYFREIVLLQRPCF